MDVDPLCAGCTGTRYGLTTLHYASAIMPGMTNVSGYAAPAERVAMVRVLLERGADPNAVAAGGLYQGGNEVGSKPVGGPTPLMFTATWTDHAAALEAAELLLDAGADVNIRTLSVFVLGDSVYHPVAGGDTALSLARAAGNDALVARLLEAGATDWDLEAEVRAANSMSLEEIKEILDTKTVDHERIWTLWFDQNLAKSPIGTMLDAGLDPNARTWGGKYTPLWATVLQAGVYARLPPDDLRAIVEAGADVDAAGTLGMPPLVVVIDQYADYRYLEVLSMLLEAGANLEGRAADGDTPLLRMMYTQRSVDVEDLLLAAGADANAQNDAGQRPVSVAVRAPKHLAFIDRLLAKGANLNADVGGAPLWAFALEHNPLYVAEPKELVDVRALVEVVLDRIVNYPGLVIDLGAPAVEQALSRADSSPLVKPFADVIRARAGTAPACGHDICEAGPSLVPGCDACAKGICDEDPYCCEEAWDALCVAEVASICAATCD